VIFPVGVEGSRLRGLPWFSIVFVLLALGAFLLTGGDASTGVVAEDVQDRWVEALYEGHVGVALPEPCTPQDTGLAAELTGLADELRAAVGDTGLADEWAHESGVVQKELDALCATAADTPSDPVTRWGLSSAKGALQVGWLTHVLMHADWFHLLGNLLFFILVCGPVLEDVYRAPLFGALFVGAGVVAGGTELLVSGSPTTILGASGAIAGCTGAFCTRFARRRIGFAYVFLIVFRPVYGTFAVPAWAAGCFWLLQDVTYQVLFGAGSGVVYMAHVAGMVFGVAAAVAIRRLDLEARIGLPLDDPHWQLPTTDPAPAPVPARDVPEPAVYVPGRPTIPPMEDEPVRHNLPVPGPSSLRGSEQPPEAGEGSAADEDDPVKIDW